MTQLQADAAIGNSPRVRDQMEAAQALQRKAETNSTGLPDQLKAGIESLSGVGLDHVKVHYNSSQPSQLNAHAYAQGGDIHLAPGQEKHLPHEAWHVVQQAQGRVAADTAIGGVGVNTAADLEAEADAMGSRAATHHAGAASGAVQRKAGGAATTGVVQRLEDEDIVTKTDKAKLKDLKAKYSARLGFGKPLYEFAEETFDYLFGKASSLSDLEARIDAQILRAQRRKDDADLAKAAAAQPTAAAAAPIQLPAAAPAPVPVVKEEKKEAKPKPVKVAATDLGFKYGAPTVQQPYEALKLTTNPLILQWIAARPGGSTITYTGIHVSADTVYIYIRVSLQQVGLEIPVHDLEIHYHPVPTTANYLHVKARAGGAAGNIIRPASWLIPAGRLDAADAAWNAEYPGNPSTRPRG